MNTSHMEPPHTGESEEVMFSPLFLSLTCCVLVLLGLLTTVGNLITARGLMKLKYTPSNLLFINIAITYTVVSLTVHPFSMYVLAVQHLQETDRIVVQILCQITGLVFELSLYSTLFSLGSISVDRFAIVYFPLRYKLLVSKRRVMLWCILCWISALSMTLPVALNYSLQHSTRWVYSTHNTTAVCQGKHWFLEPSENYTATGATKQFQKHVFVHIVAIVYILLCLFSMIPNIAIIARLRANFEQFNQAQHIKKKPGHTITELYEDSYSEAQTDEPSTAVTEQGYSPLPSAVTEGNSPLSPDEKDPLSEALPVVMRAHHLTSCVTTKVKVEEKVPTLCSLASKRPSNQSLGAPLAAPSSKFQGHVKRNVFRKVSHASSFITRDMMLAKQSKQNELRKKRQRAIVTTLIIMCMVCLLSTGLYGIAGFAANLSHHDHDSAASRYITFFAPFLMFIAMVVIPVIHYWRNSRVRDKINEEVRGLKAKCKRDYAHKLLRRGSRIFMPSVVPLNS